MKSRALRLISLSAMLSWFILVTISSAYSAVIYVKPAPEGNDSNSGLSWSQAKATVNGAIAAAASRDEIWVKAGTYAEHVQNKVVNNAAVDVALYGGFAGNETSRNQRDRVANRTILDGGGSGTVVSITDGAGSRTRVDGFFITGGSGGISIANSAPVIANNTISGNMGSGVTILKYQIIQIDPPVVAHPTITRNTIADNISGNGGGIVVAGDLLTNLVPAPAASPVISNNIITRNTAFQNGGGIGCWGHTAPVITNNYILANSATTYEPGWDGDDPVGPWLVGGGGIFASKKDMGGTPVEYAISAPRIYNNVVAANGALLGGGICLVDYPRLSEPNNPPAIVTNNTVVANNGSGIYWGNTFPRVRNNLVAFNTWGLEQDQSSSPTLGYNNVFGNTVQGGKSDYKGMVDQTGTNGNISADPRMANYEIGEFHLQPGSPCRDAGSVDFVGSGWTDIDGQNRVVGAGVDIGADESDGTSWSPSVPVIHVKPDGDDARDGSTWAKAKGTVAGGIEEAALTGGEVWVAAGSYSEHIAIPPFVYLYGGFAGTETRRDRRDIASNPSILDGGGAPTIVTSRNAGYLVSALDGFTVQNGGVYRGNVIPGALDGVEGRGGGVRSQVTALYIRNNTITRNSFGNPFDNANKRGHGAGIHGYLSHSIIEGNTVTENEILNTFDGSGAGMYFKLSMPTIDGNTITENHARYGGAIHCILSIPRIVHNVIADNAMYAKQPLYMGAVEGAVTLDMGEDFTIEGNLIRGNTAATGAGITVKTNLAGRILNNLIVGNSAYDPTAGGGMGGGIYCLPRADGVDKHYIVNNTIVHNTASTFLGGQGGGIAVALPAPLPVPEPPPPAKLFLANNIIAMNSSGIFQYPMTPMLVPTLFNNDLFNTGANYINLSAGASDLTADPLFVDPDGADDVSGTTEDNDYRIRPYSPCVDGGYNNVSVLPGTDFVGDPRAVDGDSNGSVIVDIGAYEFPPHEPALQADFNGDGKTDILFRNLQSGKVWIWLMNGTKPASRGYPGKMSLDWEIAGSGDFDGDGNSDILWHNRTRGRLRLWLMDGTSIAASGTYRTLGLDWLVAGVGDFNADTRSDILWRHALTGKVRVWLMNGTLPPSPGFPGSMSLDWSIAGVSDFNRDGTSDILWHNVSLHKVSVWLQDGVLTTASRTYDTAGSDWMVAGVGDFSADRKSDILLRSNKTGRLELWLMSGVVRKSVGYPGKMGLTWGFTGLGDFNGDRKVDILWHSRPLGKVSVWLMDGATKSASKTYGTSGLDWLVAGLGGFNVDKKSDIVWRNCMTGKVRVWLMDGMTRTSNGYPGVASSVWEVQ